MEGVEQRRIHEDEARTAVEVFLTGGDTHVYAVTHWDDVVRLAFQCFFPSVFFKKNSPT